VPDSLVMRITWFGAALLAATCATSVAAAQQGAPALEKSVLADGIYLFRAPETLDKWTSTNVVVIVGDDEVTVFDTNSRSVTARMVIDEIRKITQKPVRTLINSHWHLDHWSGNADYVAAYPGVRIIATTQTRDYMRRMTSGFFADEVGGSAKAVKTALDSAMRAGKLTTEERRARESEIADAGAFGAEVASHPFEHYGAQRNWALENLAIDTPWVLNVDADERVTPEMRDSIAAAVAAEEPGLDGYLFSRRTMFMGRWIRHGGHYPAWHLRLFRTGVGRCEERLYDQHFHVPGAVRQLPGDLIDTLTPDVATFVRRHVRWAELEADEQQGASSEGRVAARLRSANAIERRRWLRNAYNRLPLFVRPVLYFGYRYVVRLGFLDGREGLVFHFLQGFWYRMMVDAVLFERRTRARRGSPSPAGEAVADLELAPATK